MRATVSPEAGEGRGDGGQRGGVTREADFLARYRREVVGAAVHAELWVPAEELDAFNAHIVGLIEVIARFPP